MWSIQDKAGRQLLLPRESVIEGNVLTIGDFKLTITGNLQSLDPAVLDIIRASVPTSVWASRSTA